MHFVKPKGILSQQHGINVYRGCLHGCIYCDSRSKCYQINHTFEDIEVKINAPELLEMALRNKRNKFRIMTGSMSDPYIPIEKELCITRRCLEVIEKYGFGVAVLTKSDLVLRDLDILLKIHEKAHTYVMMTLTTADDDLCAIVEPHVSRTSKRVEALKIFHQYGIPTIVWLGPILPFINDTRENIYALVQMCREAGVKAILCFGMGLTLREGDREYYYEQLDRFFPGLKERYLKTYGNAYHVPSPHHKALMDVFVSECQKSHIEYRPKEVFKMMSELPQKYEQLSLFD